MENNDNNLGINEIRAFIFEIINSMSEAELRGLLKELEERQNKDRREYRRKIFHMLVDYIVGDRYYRDFIHNISERGIFIKTSKSFEKGQTILMTFMSPDYQKPFKMNGEIIQIQTDGVGVKFKLENQDQRAALKRLIEMIHGD